MRGNAQEGDSMLQNLHVKNLALIDESEVDFAGGLNILSGPSEFSATYGACPLSLPA